MSLFGAPATSTPKPLFGSTGPAASTGNLFGASSTAPSGLFGAPAASSAAPTGGLFGAPAASTAASGGLFGAKPAGTGGGLFGAPAAKAPATSLFSFNAPAATTTTGGGGLFGAVSTAAAQAQAAGPAPAAAYGPAEDLARLVQSVTAPVAFGDERDEILGRLNAAQAAFGVGKGCVAPGQPPVNYALTNPYCRFKAVCYNRIPAHGDAEGLVGLAVKQPLPSVQAKLTQLTDGLKRLLGGRPTIDVEVEAVRASGPEASEVVVYVVETGATGLRRRIPAKELAAHLRTGSLAAQLGAELGVTGVAAKASLDPAQLAEYLNGPPPAGLPAVVWSGAKAENPDPDHLLPWPVLGFAELAERQRRQQSEAAAQAEYARAVGGRIAEARGAAADLRQRLSDSGQRQAALSHRLLCVLASQTLSASQGHTLSGEEEEVRARLEALAGRSRPLGPRLDQLLSVLRTQPKLLSKEPAAQCRLSKDQVSEVGWFLTELQEGLDSLGAGLAEQRRDLDVAQHIVANTNA